MARYDYECESCNLVVEIEKSIKDSDTEERCSICNKIMKKLISNGSTFHLKGSGWAKDGYCPGGKGGG